MISTTREDNNKTIETIIFTILQLTVTPGLSLIVGREIYHSDSSPVYPLNFGSWCYVLLIITTICGGLIHFIFLLHSESKLLKHNNKRLELEASPAQQTIIGSILSFLKVIFFRC